MDVAEAIVICIDNSKWMQPNSWKYQAQLEAIRVYSKAKLCGHPETVVGLYTMSSVNSQPLLRYPTRSLGKIVDQFSKIDTGFGDLDLRNGLQLGRVPIGKWLGRKKLTMLFLVGGLTNLSLGWVEHFAIEYKNMGLAVEIVNFYQGKIHQDAWIYNQYGRDELYEFAKLCNGNDDSRYVEVKHGSDISDVLFKTLLKDTPCHPAAAAAVADDEARGSKQRDDIDRRIYNVANSNWCKQSRMILVERRGCASLALKVLSKTMDSVNLTSDKLELAEVFLSSTGKVKYQVCTPDALSKMLVKYGVTLPAAEA